MNEIFSYCRVAQTLICSTNSLFVCVYECVINWRYYHKKRKKKKALNKMMEIKQNTSMDFNDLMSTSKSDVNTSVNDGDSVMTDLTLNNLENHLITTASGKSLGIRKILSDPRRL